MQSSGFGVSARVDVVRKFAMGITWVIVLCGF